MSKEKGKEKRKEWDISTLKTRLSYAKKFEKERRDQWKKILKILDFKRDVMVSGDTRTTQIKYPLLWSAYDNYLSTLSTSPPQIVIDADGREDQVKKIYWKGALERSKKKAMVEDTEEQFLQSLIATGKAVLKVFRSVETVKNKTDVTDLDGKKVGETTDEAVVKNVSVVENIDPRRVFISPETKYKSPVLGEECPYIIEEMIKTPEYLEEKYGITIENDELESIDDTDFSDESTSQRQSDFEDSDDMKRVRLYAYYGLWRIEGKLEKNAEVLFTSKRIVKKRKFPYKHGKKPYIYALNFKDFFKPTAKGSLDAVVDLDQEYNESMNRIRTYIRRMVNPKWAKLKGTQVDEAALLDPDMGTLIDESQPNSFRPVTPPQLDPSVFEKASSVEQLFQLLTGIVYGSAAIKEAGTATGQNIVEKGADVKLGRIARIYERACEERDVMLLQLEQEYAPKEGTDIRILGADIVQQIKDKKTLFQEQMRLWQEEQQMQGGKVDEQGQPLPQTPPPVDEYEDFTISEDGRSVITNYTPEKIEGLFELNVISQSSNRGNRTVQAQQIKELLPQTVNELEIRKALWRRLATNYGWDEVIDAVENTQTPQPQPTMPPGNAQGNNPEVSTENSLLQGANRV